MSNIVTRSMFFKLAKELCKKDMVEDLNEKDKRSIAKQLLYMCFQHSSNAEKSTQGYGEMDANGSFEFPLTEADLKQMKAGKL